MDLKPGDKVRIPAIYDPVKTGWPAICENVGMVFNEPDYYTGRGVTWDLDRHAELKNLPGFDPDKGALEIGVCLYVHGHHIQSLIIPVAWVLRAE